MVEYPAPRKNISTAGKTSLPHWGTDNYASID